MLNDEPIGPLGAAIILVFAVLYLGLLFLALGWLIRAILAFKHRVFGSPAAPSDVDLAPFRDYQPSQPSADAPFWGANAGEFWGQVLAVAVALFLIWYFDLHHYVRSLLG